MTLKIVMPNEVSQSQKDKHKVPLICGYHEKTNSQRRRSRTVGIRDYAEGKMELQCAELFLVVCVWDNEKVLEMASGDSCMTLNLLNATEWHP